MFDSYDKESHKVFVYKCYWKIKFHNNKLHTCMLLIKHLSAKISAAHIPREKQTSSHLIKGSALYAIYIIDNIIIKI